MLRRAWIDEWERDGPPPPLAMPLQRALAAEARVRIARPSHQEGTGPDRGVPVGWPWTFGRFRDEMRAPDLSAYTVTPAGLAPERSMA